MLEIRNISRFFAIMSSFFHLFTLQTLKQQLLTPLTLAMLAQKRDENIAHLPYKKFSSTKGNENFSKIQKSTS